MTLTGGMGLPKEPLQSVYVWGTNTIGQLGLNIGSATSRLSSPVQLGSVGSTWTVLTSSGLGGQAAGVKSDGTLYAWGRGNVVGSAFNDTVDRSSPVQVGALTTWTNVAIYNNNTLAVKSDNTLWVWGYNNQGQLGLGDINSRSSPVQVGLLTNWTSKISAGSWNGNTGFAIKNDGTLWAWGYNANGELGDGTVISRSSPVQIGSNTNWSSVTNDGVCHAIRTDGTLWAWGPDTQGWAGFNLAGIAAYRSSPTQVGILTDWLNASAPSNSGGNPIFLKSNGTLWTWGWGTGVGSADLVGDNSAVNRSSPIQIGGSTWTAVGSTGSGGMALKNDNTLWTWGTNLYGVGDNSGINRSSPVQIGGSTWTNTVLSGGYAVFVITSQ